MCVGQPSFDYAWHCGGLCNDDDGTLTGTDNKNQSSSAGQFFDTLFHAFPFFPCRTQNGTERRKCLLLSFILYFILSHSICVPSLFSWYKLFSAHIFLLCFLFVLKVFFSRYAFHTFGFTLFSVWMLFPVFISFNLEFVRSNCFYWLGPMATITTSPSPATDSYKYTFGN